MQVAHYVVGQKRFCTIANLGGTMPEELPTPDAIGKAQSKVKNRLLGGRKRINNIRALGAISIC